MRVITTLISTLMLPIIILNLLGGIIAGIWLAILGEWRAIGIGIASIFVSHFALSFALMLSMPLMFPVAYFIEKRNKIGIFFFGFLNLAYTMGLITFWCVGVLYFFASMATSQSIIPMLVWSYGIALSPWIFLAQKDEQAKNDFSTFSTFLAEIAYIIAILMVLFIRTTILNILIMFGVIMGIGALLQLGIAIMSDNNFGFRNIEEERR
jgi:hypothetical protein